MDLSNYPNGITSFGIPVFGTGSNVFTGNVFWVLSTVGLAGNPGTFESPFDKIETAYNSGRVAAGDWIIVKEGHNEAVIAAAGLDLDKANTTVIFLGEGQNQAKITFGTDVAADMDIDVAGITLVNPKFVAAIDALTGPIDVNAADFTIVNGSYYDAAGIDTTDCIVADANATRLKIEGWKYFIGDEGGTQKQSNIQLNGTDDVVLKDISIQGDFATGNIENITDEILRAKLENIYLRNSNASPTPGIVLDGNATGTAKNVNISIASGTTYVSSVAKIDWCTDCLGYIGNGSGGDPIGSAGGSTIEGKVDQILAQQAGTAGITTFPAGAAAANSVSMAEVLRYVQENVINGTGTALPANKSLADFVGVGTGTPLAPNSSLADYIGIGAGTKIGADKSLVDAVGSNGTTLSYGSGSVLGAKGTEFAVTSLVTSSAIPNNTQTLALTNASTGVLLIKEITINTDATGLANPTNIEISTDNAKGVTGAGGPIAVEVIGSFGANATVVVTKDATSHTLPYVLETGKIIYIHGDDNVGTGAGTADVTIVFQRLTDGASATPA